MDSRKNKTESNETESIEQQALSKLLSYGKLIISGVTDEDLQRLSIDDFDISRVMRDYIKESDIKGCKTWLDYANLLKARLNLEVKNGYTGSTYKTELNRMLNLAAANQLDAIEKNIRRLLEEFSEEFSKYKSDPNCKATYALIIMHQVLEHKKDGLDIERLVAAKKYLGQISEENSEYRGIKKLIDLYILPAAFLAKKDSAKSAVEYVKACESMSDNKKMGEFDTERFLQAFNDYCTGVMRRTQGNTGEMRLAGAEEGTKILKALRKTETFASPKKASQFKAEDRVGKLLQDYQRYAQEAKQDIKEEERLAAKGVKK